MCRSSRILIFVGLLAATPALGQGRMGLGPGPGGPGPGTAPIAPGAVRPAIRPGVQPGVNPGVLPNVRRGVMPNVRPGVAPNVRGGILPGFNRGFAYGAVRPRPGRFGRFGTGSALGLAGLGLSLADDLPYPPGDAGFGGDEFGSYPAPIIPAIAPPPPCAKPLIIQIGHGLRHKAKTRVVFGSQSNCGR